MKIIALTLAIIGTLSTIEIGHADTNVTVSIKTLVGIPEKRHAALILFAITGHDSSPDITAKREKYYDALKSLTQDLRNEYYWHDEYPTNVFAGIEERADALVAANYPMSASTGASFVDSLTERYRIQMAEETIQV